MKPEVKSPNSDGRELLTHSGQARRDSMRDQLQTEFVRLHRRRKKNRSAIVWSVVATAVLVAAGLFSMRPDRSTSNPSIDIADHSIPAVETSELQYVLALSELQSPGIEFELINDDQLLDMLAEAGHPSALAWIQGKPVVIPLDNGPPL